MSRIIDELARNAGLGRPLAITIAIVGLFVAAWLVSRIASKVASTSSTATERRRAAQPTDDTAVLTGIRQRETAISLIQTTIRYLAFLVALVFSLVALSGAHRIQTIAGASFLAIVVGFAAQRFLTDVIAGLLMFFEGWFRIGDTVAIDALQVQGIVEAVSLRSLTIRSMTGEILHVANSQVVALRVIPRGYREVEIEFFTSALEPGRGARRAGRADRPGRPDALHPPARADRQRDASTTTSPDHRPLRRRGRPRVARRGLPAVPDPGARGRGPARARPDHHVRRRACPAQLRPRAPDDACAAEGDGPRLGGFAEPS